MTENGLNGWDAIQFSGFSLVSDLSSTSSMPIRRPHNNIRVYNNLLYNI